MEYRNNPIDMAGSYPICSIVLTLKHPLGDFQVGTLLTLTHVNEDRCWGYIQDYGWRSLEDLSEVNAEGWNHMEEGSYTFLNPPQTWKESLERDVAAAEALVELRREVAAKVQKLQEALDSAKEQLEDLIPGGWRRVVSPYAPIWERARRANDILGFRLGDLPVNLEHVVLLQTRGSGLVAFLLLKATKTYLFGYRHCPRTGWLPTSPDQISRESVSEVYPKWPSWCDPKVTKTQVAPYYDEITNEVTGAAPQ